ncbi:MAG TPA: hypothetical protein VL972_06635 [Solirubrobacteraceae bacterium]|nr:hypothetical protein [Solirubrobacteraceae bacterium]
MVACVHIPRFELHIAAGGEGAEDGQGGAGGGRAGGGSQLGRALALAPRAGGEQRVGEVSGAAEGFGVVRGMVLGEALARCPELVLLAPDPVAAADVWEGVLEGLEAIGAAVEPARPGLAYFDLGGLRGMYGSEAATLAAAQGAVRAALGGRSPRMGVGPTRFCALAGALAVRSRRALTLEGREAVRWLAGQPVGLLGFREDTAALVAPLSRLGVRTLGELAALGRPALTDRFGRAGALAHGLAGGEDAPVCARRARERMEESMAVGEASSGEALKRVLSVLVKRLLARSERRGRTLRAVTLSARLVSGGGWRERVVFRQALCDPERVWLALSVRLLMLPAPASELGLGVESFGPPGHDQGVLVVDQAHRSARAGVWAHAEVARSARLRGALAQMRALAGQEAVLRAVSVDPDSRVPERRVVLAPVSE